jgi:CDP-2,3-bis-(O-geranylgeranyl)-sn-glycerol synthase
MDPFSAEWFLGLFVFIIPAYFANSSAVYFNPRIHGRKDPPIDMGIRFFDNKPLIGSKGIEGMVAAILFGTFVGVVIGWMGFRPLGLSFDQWVTVSFFLSLGTHFGDKLGSFLKRRLDIEGGEKFEYFDQLGFLVCALAFASIAEPQVAVSLGPTGYVVLIALSYLVHRGANIVGYWLGLKNVPW